MIDVLRRAAVWWMSETGTSGTGVRLKVAVVETQRVNYFCCVRFLCVSKLSSRLPPSDTTSAAVVIYWRHLSHRQHCIGGRCTYFVEEVAGGAGPIDWRGQCARNKRKRTSRRTRTVR